MGTRENMPSETPAADSPPMYSPRRPVPATRDTFVHYLFGTKQYADILLAFINAVLENGGREPVVSVETLNPFDPATFVTEKYTILDVKATDTSGKIFMIEFQTSGYASFAERLLYYWARTYARQLNAGSDYRTLQPVISIAVIGYHFFKRLPDIHNVFSIVCENDPRYRLTDDLQIHTLEAVPEKFDALTKLKPPLRRWVQFFYESDKKSEREMKTLLKGDGVLNQAYAAYQQFNADMRLRAIDDAREQYLHDVASQKGDAFRKGKAEGIIEGEVRGEAKGRAETARKMKEEGFPVDAISRLTGLSAEEIRNLR